MALKATQATTYTNTEVDNNLELKANQTTTYTKTEVDNNLALKANQATIYTETEVNNSLALKANLINNAPGTSERLLKANILKRICAVAPLNVRNLFKY